VINVWYEPVRPANRVSALVLDVGAFVAVE